LIATARFAQNPRDSVAGIYESECPEYRNRSMSSGVYYSRPYKIGTHLWRLIVDGSPPTGYQSRWQWREPDEKHWYDILCFPHDHPPELFQIARNQEHSALADYRLEQFGDYSYPHFAASPARHSFLRLPDQNKRRRPRRR
jgi:hypothetical protein